MKAEGEYQQYIDIPGEIIQVFLAGLTTIDPPLDKAETIGASFIDITQARNISQTELELLRTAYEFVLGG